MLVVRLEYIRTLWLCNDGRFYLMTWLLVRARAVSSSRRCRRSIQLRNHLCPHPRLQLYPAVCRVCREFALIVRRSAMRSKRNRLLSDCFVNRATMRGINKWRWCLRMVAANLSADSQPKSVGLAWGLAATRRSVCIHQMNRVNSRNDYVMMIAP